MQGGHELLLQTCPDQGDPAIRRQRSRVQHSGKLLQSLRGHEDAAPYKKLSIIQLEDDVK